MGQAGAWRTCANCGAVNPPNEQFCGSCGYSLAGGPTFSPSPGSAQPTVPVAGARRDTGGLSGGTLIGGRYRVVRLVGKGGFGAVYEAVDERFQARRVVAIKEMSDAQLTPAEKAQAIQDFRHEADLLVQLHHQNLPQVSDFFEEAGKAYLVMDFVEGKTLEKEQEDTAGPLPEARVMGFALQLCEVLGYLHTRIPPVIFRDLKPSNVMLTPEDEIKLIDFGIARVFKSAANKDTTSLGSRGYAPLEQYGRTQSDARSDIYALGATLYDLLTKTTPADAATRRVNPLAFKALRQLNPAISRASEQIILKAMQEEARDRYQSAAEMYQAIASSGVVSVTNVGMRTVITPPPAPLPPTTPAPLPPTTPASYAQPAPTVPAQHTVYGQQPAAAPVAAPALGGGQSASPPAAFPAPLPAPGGPQPGPQQVSRRRFLRLGVAGAATVAVGAGVYFIVKNVPAGDGSGNVTGPTITVNFTYSTEKEPWMKPATAAFNRSGTTLNGKAIQVALNELGSVDGHDQILKGQLKPTAWSPASFLELNQLINDWAAAHPGQEIVVSNNSDLDPQSLVFSPLVFGVWKSRAQVLKNHYGADKIDWPAIHDVLTKKSWADIGGPSDWGSPNFGQTRPDASNSGLLAITLIAYSYYQEQNRLTKAQVDAAKFLSYLGDIESVVNGYGQSSGTYMSHVVIPEGPAQYNMVATYENLVLTLQQQAVQRWEPLQLYYPQVNIVSDHPFAIMRGDWVTQDEQMAAQKFRDFLLSDAQQRAALTSGFRPSNPNVHYNDKVPNNPFLGQSSDIVIQPEIQNLAQPPGGDVVDELISQWKTNWGDLASAPGG
ncbi:MAG TPA: protein kinase [Ktedonobacterales bacterium]|nr:protein kinase [Ktedonobacterales bacterium]